MTTLRPLMFALASLALLTSYDTSLAYAAPNKIYATSMQSRLQYRGFSVARPPLSGWYLVPGEQSHTDAMFRRDTPEGGTYSAFVSVALRSLPRAATSETDFAQLAR